MRWLDDNAYLDFYTEYQDSMGLKHYSVHKYKKTNGRICSMRDYKFPDHDYSDSKSFIQFIVEKACNFWLVIDQADDTVVGKFYNQADAYDYAEYKNKSMTW